MFHNVFLCICILDETFGQRGSSSDCRGWRQHLNKQPTDIFYCNNTPTHTFHNKPEQFLKIPLIMSENKTKRQFPTTFRFWFYVAKGTNLRLFDND